MKCLLRKLFRLFTKVFVVDIYVDTGLVLLCGPRTRPLQASQTDLTGCSALAWSWGGGVPPYFKTPKFWVELLRYPHRQDLSSCPWVLPLPIGLFYRELATTPLLCPFSLSGSPWVRERMSFLQNPFILCQELAGSFSDLYFFLSFFFHSTLNLVLNNYMSCHDYVCEWIVQNSKMSCKKILLYCNVHGLTWEKVLTRTWQSWEYLWNDFWLFPK